MGEAYGYRTTVDSTMAGARTQAAPVAAATKDASSDRIASLEKTVLSLGNKLEKLLTSNIAAAHAQAGRTSGRRVPSRVCYACSGEGHVKRQCNLGEGEGDPSVTCQLCLQKGHNGKQCKLFVNTNSGKLHEPKEHRARPLGRTVNERARSRPPERTKKVSDNRISTNDSPYDFGYIPTYKHSNMSCLSFA